MPYYRFSRYLKERYGSRVYKLPLNLPCTCPNRDGTLGGGGCIFCGEEGAGFESLSHTLSVGEQLEQNSRYIGGKYKSGKFIAYFQNFSNTYMPLDSFRRYIHEACADGIVAIYISTRPDCVNDSYLEFLAGIKNTKQVDIVLELGLQTVNYRTLKFLKRGHSLAEFIDAVLRIKKFGLESCAHYILDLPTDTLEDAAEGAKILSALQVEQVKCHSLYILKDTALGDMYEKGEAAPVSLGEYVERAVAFLEHLSPGIAVQRLIGRAPGDRALFSGWGMSWWRIRDMVEEKMLREGRRQGGKAGYLNGAACMGRFT